jgi:hypothetical protein
MVKACQDHLLNGTDTQWTEYLNRFRHDIYHTPFYHAVPGLGREGEAFAFVHREGDEVFLWPYLLKPIGDTGYFDVTSVYGYAGPVSSPNPDFIERGWLSLLDAWRSQNVVSAFTRFHPMLENHRLLQGHAAGAGLRHRGSTVSIDVTIPLDEQVRRYQKVHRQEIRRAREAGFVTTLDEEWVHAEDFVRLYGLTMARLNSRPEYLVDMAWVDEFRKLLGTHARLFVTKLDGRVAVTSLVMEYGPYLHGHLIGADGAFSAHSPMKIALDNERIWATEKGLEACHMGGGLGGREDSLYQFKRKFSPLTHEFYIGTWILNPARYRELEDEHRRKLGIELGDPGFFPIYRYQPSGESH